MIYRLKNTICSLSAVLALTVPNSAFSMDNYGQARQLLPVIFNMLDKPATIYCGCPLTFPKPTAYSFDAKECGYVPKAQNSRSYRVESEHIMPAYDFGRQLRCWQKGGRRRCQKDSSDFNIMEGDMHNLWPVIGEINGARSNYRFSDWNGTGTDFGKCHILIDSRHSQVQPPESARGIIARAYLYMSSRYKVRLTKRDLKMYEVWDKTYAPSFNECKKNLLTEILQGSKNKYVSQACELHKINVSVSEKEKSKLKRMHDWLNRSK